MPNHSLNDTHIGSISIYLDSTKATTKSGLGQCSFYLENVIQAPVDTHLMISLDTAQIPVSYYNTTAANNELVFFDSTNGTTRVLLASKNYNTETLVIEMNRQLVLNGLSVLVFSFDEDTFKFSFSNPTGLVYSLVSCTMDKQIGLPNTTLPAVVNGIGFTCPEFVNLSGTQSIYVMLNNIAIQSLDSRSGGDLDGVLGKVDVSRPFGDYTEYSQAGTSQLYMMSDRQISYFNVSMTDDNLNEIDFNGVGWSISMTVHFSKKRMPTIISDYLLEEPTEAQKEQDMRDQQSKK